MTNRRTFKSAFTCRWAPADGVDGTGIKTADVVYVLTNSSTTPPADSAGWVTSLSLLKLVADTYVWSCTKVTLTDGRTLYSGKQCLGPSADFASVVEMYALGGSGSVAPSTGWGTTYTPTKNRWLWTRNRIIWTGGTISYTTAMCVGYFSKDGEKGEKGDQGEKGDPGQSAISIAVSAQSITAHKAGTLQSFTIRVTASRGSTVLAAGTDYTCSALADTANVVKGLLWTGTARGTNGHTYKLNLKANAVANVSIPFTVTDKATGIVYDYGITFATTADGDPGYTGLSIRRSEWEQGKQYRNDSADGSTAPDGNRYLDEVSVTDLASGTSKWYLAKEAHNGITSAAANKPSGNGNNYWEPINDLRPLRTSYADIMNAFIQYLQVNQIVITDSNNKPYGAFGGGTNNQYPLWFGGPTVNDAVAKFDRKGNAWIGSNFSIVNDDVNVTGNLRVNSLRIKEGSIKAGSDGKKYLNLDEKTGNYFVLPSNSNTYLPDAANYEGMQITVFFGYGTGTQTCGLSCNSGMYAPFYLMTSFDGTAVTGSMQFNCIVTDESLSSLTLVSSKAYGTEKLVWAVIAHTGVLRFPTQGANAEISYKNPISMAFLPDGRLVKDS